MARGDRRLSAGAAHAQPYRSARQAVRLANVVGRATRSRPQAVRHHAGQHQKEMARRREPDLCHGAFQRRRFLRICCGACIPICSPPCPLVSAEGAHRIDRTTAGLSHRRRAGPHRAVRLANKRRSTRSAALNGCAEKGVEWAAGCTSYPSDSGTPLVTLIHPSGHCVPERGPGLDGALLQGALSESIGKDGRQVVRDDLKSRCATNLRNTLRSHFVPAGCLPLARAPFRLGKHCVPPALHLPLEIPMPLRSPSLLCFALAVVAIAPWIAVAAEPNTLTPQELDEGWDPALRWPDRLRLACREEGRLKVADGTITVSSRRAWFASHDQRICRLRNCGSNFAPARHQ